MEETNEKTLAFEPTKHLIQLKGKDYLEVKYRLVWFREENPGGTIETELVERGDGWALFKAFIRRDNGAVATGYAQETVKDFGEYLEKAETKAVGRALGMLGYGTQFAPDLDFEEDGKDKVVDSPVQRTSANHQSDHEPEATHLTSTDGPFCPKCGGDMWDNRKRKLNPKAPDYKCKDKDCDGVIWPEKGNNPKEDIEPQSIDEALREFDRMPEEDYR